MTDATCTCTRLSLSFPHRKSCALYIKPVGSPNCGPVPDAARLDELDNTPLSQWRNSDAVWLIALARKGLMTDSLTGTPAAVVGAFPAPGPQV